MWCSLLLGIFCFFRDQSDGGGHLRGEVFDLDSRIRDDGEDAFYDD